MLTCLLACASCVRSTLQLDSTVQSALTNVIKGLNKPLQNVNLDFPLASWGAHANFDLTSSPRTTSSYVGMDAVGEVLATAACATLVTFSSSHALPSAPSLQVVNTKKPVPPPSGVVPPNVPPFSTADASHYVQLGISTYFFESLAWVYTQAGQLQTTVQHNALPSGFVFQLNTTGKPQRTARDGLTVTHTHTHMWHAHRSQCLCAQP